MRGIILLLIGAAALGIFIARVDSRPGWDDTGITVGAILLSCAVLGGVSPKHAWQWALAVGIWIPLSETIWLHNNGSILALVPAFLGAYAGAGLRSLVFPPATQA